MSKRFEELPAWQEAAALALNVYRFTDLVQDRLPATLRSRLETAALEVAEAVAQAQATQDTHQVRRAKASIASVQSILAVVELLPSLSDHGQAVSSIRGFATTVSERMASWHLHGMPVGASNPPASSTPSPAPAEPIAPATNGHAEDDEHVELLRRREEERRRHRELMNDLRRLAGGDTPRR